jgi:uncharacterized protein (DUF302 family)
MNVSVASPLGTIRCVVAVGLAFALGACASTPTATPDNGLVAVRSPYSTAETIQRLEAQIKERNLAVVAKVDHAAGAQRINQTLRATEVVIFGNPQAGTPLMQCAQGVGIDLPMKALVWTDAQQQTWLAYNDPAWLVKRHGGGECPAAANVARALAGIAQAVVAR